MTKIEYPDDCERIQRVMLYELEIAASIVECYQLWEEHSRSRAERWLIPPSSDWLLSEELRRLMRDKEYERLDV